MKSKIGINFGLELTEVTDLNPSFAAARVAIAYSGKNRNKSIISKEVFESAAPSICNIPLVGRYIPEENDFGAHDIRVIKNDDGEYSIENATIPFGVVPMDTTLEWKTVTEDDGTERDYLFCDVILWKRQYGYKCLVSQKRWNQSMEIGVNSYIVDNEGYCVIEDMYYEALCILGKNVTPCFESASVQLNLEKAVSDYAQQFSLMLDELKKLTPDLSFKGCFQKKDREEEKNKLNTEIRNQILTEFGKTLEDLTFEVTEDMTEEDFRAKLQAEATPVVKDQSFSATYRQKYEALENALSGEIKRDENGDTIEEITYFVSDFDDSYVFVTKYIWRPADFDKYFGRFSYTFDSESNTAEVSGEFEEMVWQLLTIEENEKLKKSRDAFEQMKKDFNEYKAKYTTPDSEVEKLREFQNGVLTAEHEAEVEAILDEFADLSENPEFVALAEKAYDFTDLDELREKCFAIRGKSVVITFGVKHVKKSSPKLPIKTGFSLDCPYADIVEKYEGL